MVLKPDTLVHGRYRVVSLIGQGGMGAVYEAMDERLSQTVALKQTLLTDERYRQTFQREAKILAGLRHISLPKVTDYFTDTNGQFLVMEFIAGDDLETILRQYNDPLPVATVLDIADQVLAVLEYLHRQEPPIIHRDIKPQNLKMTADGVVILLDFGLAKGLLSQDAPGSKPQSIYGYTVEYAPLEQIQGTGTGPRSDLYSLGAMIYHFLTNRPPLGSLNRGGLLISGKADPLRPVHEVNPQVPPEIGNIIHRALSIQAEDRPASASEMRTLLQQTWKQVEARASTQTLSGEEDTFATVAFERPARRERPLSTPRHSSASQPASQPTSQPEEPTMVIRPSSSPSTPPPPPQYAAHPPASAAPSPAPDPSRQGGCRGRPGIIIGGLVAVLVLAIGGATAFLFIGNGNDDDGPANGSPSVSPTSDPGVSLPTIHPTHPSPPAEAKPITPDTVNQLTLLAQETGSGSINAIAFSPNNHIFASGAEDGSVHLWDATGTLIRILGEAGGAINSVAFTPDGEHMVVGQGGSVQQWRVENGTPGQTFAGQGGRVFSVALSPDGQMVAAGSLDQSVRLWNSESGELLHTLREHQGYVNSVAFSPDGQMLASGAHDKTIMIWDVQQGTVLHTLEGHSGAVFSLAFSPDGQSLASGSEDKTVCLWRVRDGSLVHTLSEHKGSVYSVAFSPDGQLLAAGADDETIILWQMPEGTALRTLAEQTGTIYGLAFSPDGSLLVAGTSDKQVGIWGIE
jgi:WD40 repeat protein